jgi:lipopolysaccharide/colanic/teichoic acid biosynthesis glycosyltransferase
MRFMMSANLKASRNKALMNNIGSTELQVEWMESVSAVGDGAFRRALEFGFALILGVVALPVIAIAAVVIKLTSRGPAFYSQTRVGRNGRPYLMRKLRSMRHNCEVHSGPCWSTAGDPRITRVGRVLRMTHIDELPQLWNVLRGDMSLVGPRPERPEFIPQLADAVPLYRSRLLVRPGVTGLAQVQLPADTDLESVRRKLTYDLYYVQHAGLWLDIKVVAATGLHVLGVSYARIRQLLRLPSQEAIEEAYQTSLQETEIISVPEMPAMSEREPLVKVEMATCV